MNFTIDFISLVSFCGGLTAIVGAYKIVKKPVDDMNEKFKRYDEMLSNDKKRLDELQRTNDELKADLGMIADMTYQMLDHMATNNNTGGMAEALDRYNKYYRNRR